MANRLLIILSHTDPNDPHALQAPFSQALAAVSMEYDTEIVLYGCCAEAVLQDRHCPLQKRLQEALDAGIRLKLCPQDEAERPAQLPAGIQDIVGGAYVITEVMDDQTVALNY